MGRPMAPGRLAPQAAGVHTGLRGGRCSLRLSSVRSRSWVTEREQPGPSASHPHENGRISREPDWFGGGTRLKRRPERGRTCTESAGAAHGTTSSYCSCGCWVWSGSGRRGSLSGGHTNNTFTVPGVQSQEALDQLAVGFPQAAGASATIVYHTTAAGTKVHELADRVADQREHQGTAGSAGRLVRDRPLQPRRPRRCPRTARRLSPTSSTRRRRKTCRPPGRTRSTTCRRCRQKYSTPQLQIELGGQLPGAQPIDIKDSVVIFGLIAALIVLLIALGTWWSFAWPVVGALVGTALGMGIVQILERVRRDPDARRDRRRHDRTRCRHRLRSVRHRTIQGGHRGRRRAAAGGRTSGQHRRTGFLDRWLHGRSGTRRACWYSTCQQSAPSRSRLPSSSSASCSQR